MWVSKAVPGTRLYTSFSDLPSFTAHRVRVRAVNDIGTSEYSASFAFQTLPSESVPDLVKMRGDEEARTENRWAAAAAACLLPAACCWLPGAGPAPPLSVPVADSLPACTSREGTGKLTGRSPPAPVLFSSPSQRDHDLGPAAGGAGLPAGRLRHGVPGLPAAGRRHDRHAGVGAPDPPAAGHQLHARGPQPGQHCAVPDAGAERQRHRAVVRRRRVPDRVRRRGCAAHCGQQGREHGGHGVLEDAARERLGHCELPGRVRARLRPGAVDAARGGRAGCPEGQHRRQAQEGERAQQAAQHGQGHRGRLRRRRGALGREPARDGGCVVRD
eukprot:SAG22_NODE_1971_length_3230_cov_2.800383_2_plen_329_part_00